MLSESGMVTLTKNWLWRLLVSVGMVVQWLPKDIHILTWNLEKKTHLAGQRHLFIDFRLFSVLNSGNYSGTFNFSCIISEVVGIKHRTLYILGRSSTI